MKQTPRYQLPYVESSDTVRDWPTANKALCETLEAKISSVSDTADTAYQSASQVPRIQSGGTTLFAKSDATYVLSDPIALTGFTKQPHVTVSLATAAGGTQVIVPRVYNVSATKFHIALYTGNGSTIRANLPITVNWIAVEGA